MVVELGTDAAGLVLTVTDHGIGMSAADQGRLFTRFFRSRDAGERSIQGVGLGLSIVKRIVDSHGGRIQVRSGLGTGSTFRVELPVETMLVPETRESALELRAESDQAQDGQVPKISNSWLTSENPCSAAIARVQRSTVGPSTSTARPHERHTRWWWWVSEQRR